MNYTKFVKGLIMSVVGALLVVFNSDPIVWSIVIVTLISTVMVYSGKNLFVTSKSLQGELDWRDILSALLLGIGVTIGDSITMIIKDGIIDWIILAKVSVGVISTYISTTFFTGQKK